MDTYVNIGEDVTADDVVTIEESAKSGGVYIVHSMCSTLKGRIRLLLRICQAGCDPDVARNLGWSLIDPTPKPLPVKAPPSMVEPPLVEETKPRKKNRDGRSKRNLRQP